ncbi:Co-chaperone Hsc20 [Rhizodiscina lignyota]|uniref:Co-chaperone Hsc20 n=1 Tax=Rhizodiscina lignyota TaxID=1504668 RepID=A0A9P4IHK3_9PEZI|nr:Co-chaperone Hsc20 [Rhizodiscina lignyota]
MRAASPSTLRYLRNALAHDIQGARPATRPRTHPQVYITKPLCSARRELWHSSRQPTRAYSSSASASESTKPDEPSNSSPLPTQAPKTHYDLFPSTIPSGPPPSGPFHVDPRTLRREFLQLQARAHPDLHPEPLKARAQATSALINEAYKTLQDPLRRAQYLLALRGIETDKDEAAKLGGDAGGDSELLMTVMEVNEAMEEADSEDVIHELKGENDVRIEESVGVLEQAFKEDDMETARREAVRLRYWVNIKEGLDAWERGKGTILVH